MAQIIDRGDTDSSIVVAYDKDTDSLLTAAFLFQENIAHFESLQSDVGKAMYSDFLEMGSEELDRRDSEYFSRVGVIFEAKKEYIRSQIGIAPVGLVFEQLCLWFTQAELYELRNKFTVEEFKEPYGSLVLERASTYERILKIHEITLPNVLVFDTARIEYNLHDLSDCKYTYIYFWSKYCGPCIKTVREYSDSLESFDMANIELVGITIDDDFETWVKHTRKVNPKFPQYFDPPGFITELKLAIVLLGMSGSVLVDKNFKIIARNVFEVEEIMNLVR